ncbi:MAG: alpha-amylase [Deltaproteobacteria bacterium]|nr:alpha-amylase [Deltaproteobacteria bacterium]
MSAPIIYNLFPRLAGTLDRWPAHAERARSMGFDWIYLNPVSQPGFSGSLYAVRDHDRVCRDFLPPGSSESGLDELAAVLARFRELGLACMMDLVINHTAIDSPLVERHPAWYQRDEDGEVAHPSAIDPADARKVTVWGDLAEIDNQRSEDREGLWLYWEALVVRSLELGFDGFRCDAAYKVPAALWQRLRAAARRVDPGASFFAETLGCTLEQVSALRPAGFDYLFNSSKYWDFDAPWAVEQHADFGAIAPSVSFPESHDTPRLAAETDGDLAVLRQRYFLAAVFSEGLMMPIGFEHAFRKPLHVVESRPEDWEETGVDLGPFIRTLNRLKKDLSPLGAEGRLEALCDWEAPFCALRKEAAGSVLHILVNKDLERGQEIDLAELGLAGTGRLLRVEPDGALVEAPPGDRLALSRAEIALLAV